MPIQFSCPHCGNSTEVSDQYAGQSGPCAKCGETIDIPNSSTASGPAAGPAPPSKKSGGSGIVIGLAAVAGFVVVGCMCSGILVALMLPAVQAAREAARRSSCSNNLKQTVLGVHNYHDTYGNFPNNTYDEDGGEMHSWRTQILPFVEHGNLYDEYDQDNPWDSPQNAFASDVELPYYNCPSKPKAMGTSDYMSIYANPETKPQPILTKGAVVRFSDVTDGTSNTFMVVETGSSVQWVSVNDLAFETMPMAINTGPGAQGIGSNHPGGAQASFADGSVRFIAETIDTNALRSLITRDGGEAMPGF